MGHPHTVAIVTNNNTGPRVSMWKELHGLATYVCTHRHRDSLRKGLEGGGQWWIVIPSAQSGDSVEKKNGDFHSLLHYVHGLNVLQ